MSHWVETYPHTVYASVLLKDNKIINWKIGQRKWDHLMAMTRKIKLPFDQKDYEGETVQSTQWQVNNSEEHNKVFSYWAKEWFKNWEVHEDHEGGPAYIKPVNYWDVARKLLPLSNCLKRHYACVIVRSGHIIATGYNKSLHGCSECAREGIGHNVGDYAECDSVHAEMMGLIRAREDDFIGAKLYLVCDKDLNPEPCPICQRMIQFAGIGFVREIQS